MLGCCLTLTQELRQTHLFPSSLLILQNFFSSKKKKIIHWNDTVCFTQQTKKGLEQHHLPWSYAVRKPSTIATPRASSRREPQASTNRLTLLSHHGQCQLHAVGLQVHTRSRGWRASPYCSRVPPSQCPDPASWGRASAMSLQSSRGGRLRTTNSRPESWSVST